MIKYYYDIYLSEKLKVYLTLYSEYELLTSHFLMDSLHHHLLFLTLKATWMWEDAPVMSLLQPFRGSMAG